MQRFIRNPRTGNFLDPHGNWTQDYSRARNFGDVMAVITTASQMKATRPLEQVVMVGIEPSTFDLYLPLAFD